MTMGYSESTGRKYCAHIGADPDQLVRGFSTNSEMGTDKTTPIIMERWRWYAGAICDAIYKPSRRAPHGKIHGKTHNALQRHFAPGNAQPAKAKPHTEPAPIVNLAPRRPGPLSRNGDGAGSPKS